MLLLITQGRIVALSTIQLSAAALAIRVTALERRVWTASGVAAALGAGGGIFATILGGQK